MTGSRPLVPRAIALTLQVAGAALVAYGAITLQSHGLMPLGMVLGGALIVGLASESGTQLSLPVGAWFWTLCTALLCATCLGVERLLGQSAVTVLDVVLTAITGYALGLTVRLLKSS